MAVGTDDKIFNDQNKKAPRGSRKKAGRPKVDRDLALRLFNAGYTNAKAAGYLDVKPRTAGNIRRELENEGLLGRKKTERDIVETDFDAECKRATGFSFLEWLKNKRKEKGAQRVFSFCEKTWRIIWERPSLFQVTERNEKLGDILAQKFLSVYKEDGDRIRDRKKQIRQLFTFLNRDDINNRHLTMRADRDRRAVRRIPEISMIQFPLDLEAALQEMEKLYGFLAILWLKMKICTGIRTGSRTDQRGLAGLSTDTKSRSYVTFRGGTYQCQAFEKKGETWPITWIPKQVLDLLKTVHDLVKAQTDKPQFIFPYTDHKRSEFLKAWRAISKKHTGAELTFHDLRKVSITWLYAMDIPLEIATSINVGWKDLSTAKESYLDLRAMLKKSKRIAYAANIPEWYKDGLEEYSREE